MAGPRPQLVRVRCPCDGCPECASSQPPCRRVHATTASECCGPCLTFAAATFWATLGMVELILPPSPKPTPQPARRRKDRKRS